MSHKAIDHGYRPRSYFWAADTGVRLSSDIKGLVRKRIYETSIVNGDKLHGGTFQPALSERERRAWGRRHPRNMGGEYLPDRSAGEVEIARIGIASTTYDVTSVYARQAGGRIHYRVVDEYDGETLSGKNARTSSQPLTLAKLAEFFLGAWDLIECLDANFCDAGYPREEVHGFIIDASSNFYAGFGTVIRYRVDAWLDTVAVQEEDEQ